MFKKTLKFLSLSDSQGNLSISNIAVIVIITKIATAPFDWVTAAGLLVTLLNYGHKRVESSKFATKPVDMKPVLDQVTSAVKTIEELQSKVSALSLGLKK